MKIVKSASKKITQAIIAFIILSLAFVSLLGFDKVSAVSVDAYSKTLRAIVTLTGDMKDQSYYGQVPISIYSSDDTVGIGYNYLTTVYTGTVQYISKKDSTPIGSSAIRKVYTDIINDHINANNKIMACIGQKIDYEGKIPFTKFINCSEVKPKNAELYAFESTLTATGADYLVKTPSTTNTTQISTDGTILVSVNINGVDQSAVNELKITLNTVNSVTGGKLTQVGMQTLASSNFKTFSDTTSASLKFVSKDTAYLYAACIDGYPNATQTGAEGCSDSKGFELSAKTMKLSIELSAEQYKTAMATTTETTDTKTSCAIGGVGWIVCPVSNFLANIADGAFHYLSGSFLEVKSQAFDTSNTTYDAWSAMRNIANVLFVIVFLAIIFSQMSGFGITNYGVKKMLPRLIVAAILVNTSYFICQIAIDISNIVGYSLDNMLKNFATSAIGSSGAAEDGSYFSGIIATVLGATGALVLAALSITIPMIIAAVAALIMIVFLLISRQAVVILLVVVAPIAFVAYLLPNTNSLFKQWKKIFLAMLMLFPIIALVFGASSMAASILSGAFDDSGKTIIGPVIVAAINVLPLFAVPVILKKSLNSVGNIGATINGLGDKLNKGLGNTGLAKYQEAKRADRMARISTGNYKGIGGKFNPRNVRSSLNRGLIGMSSFNKATGGYGAYKALQAQGQDRKDSQEAVNMFGGNSKLAEIWANNGGKELNATDAASLGASGAAQYKLMRNAGYQNKSSSFLAAAQMLSESGKASGKTVYNALNSAREHGANEIDISGASYAAAAAFKKSGRGDSYADLSTLSKGVTTASGIAPIAGMPTLGGMKNITQAEGWSEVDSKMIDFGTIDFTNPTYTAGDTAIAAGYRDHLLADPNNTYNALAGYNNMNPVSRNEVSGLLVSAAAAHAAAHAAATGATPPTITTIKEAKAYFAIS